MPTNVYVLQLQHGKYYVGKTSDSEGRIRQHFAGYGSSWTSLHPPIRVLKIYEGVAAADEDKITKEYMDKHGWENVRGGSYCNVDLDEGELHDKRREVFGELDRCLRCGRAGHWAKDCYASSDVIVCYKCGREGHLSTQCYAKSKVFDKAAGKRRRYEDDSARKQWRKWRY